MEHILDPNNMFIGIEGMKDERGEVIDSWEVPIEAPDIHTAQRILNEDAEYWEDPISGEHLIAGEVRKAEIDEWMELAETGCILSIKEDK